MSIDRGLLRGGTKVTQDKEVCVCRKRWMYESKGSHYDYLQYGRKMSVEVEYKKNMIEYARWHQCISLPLLAASEHTNGPSSYLPY